MSEEKKTPGLANILEGIQNIKNKYSSNIDEINMENSVDSDEEVHGSSEEEGKSREGKLFW